MSVLMLAGGDRLSVWILLVSSLVTRLDSVGILVWPGGGQDRSFASHESGDDLVTDGRAVGMQAQRRPIASRSVQQLVAEGLVIARPGMRAIPAPPQLRATKWAMTGRYARARAAQGLIFAGDVTGEVRKDTIRREWVEAPILIAQLLNIEVGARVFQRCSRTYVNNIPTEDTSMFFPEAIVKAAPRLEHGERIHVVQFIEEAGHVVTRTTNEIRARHANFSEQELFGIDENGIVIEHGHGAYGAEDEVLEAVINVRPALDNVITFDTYEAPIDNN